METALLKVHNDIMCAVDSKKAVLMILLDLSAAFDTIDHDVLIQRLHSNFGIGGTALNWIKSYLHNHSQLHVVQIQGESSTEAKVYYGVPQGSVLGPFFSLYIHSHLVKLLGNIIYNHTSTLTTHNYTQLSVPTW